MEIRDLSTPLPGLTRIYCSRVTLQASVPQCHEQRGLARCAVDSEDTIDLFPEAGVWTEPGPQIATGYGPSRRESPQIVSKGLLVDLFT